jgi:filamentous hemagglutinin
VLRHSREARRAAFGVHGNQFGNGVVHIASPGDMAGAKLYPSSLGRLEAEVGVGMSPSNFASSAGTTIPGTKTRSILSEMGISVPSQIVDVGSLNRWLGQRTAMASSQIAEFTRRATGG